jgi:hypothetical protein
MGCLGLSMPTIAGIIIIAETYRTSIQKVLTSIVALDDGNVTSVFSSPGFTSSALREKAVF